MNIGIIELVQSLEHLNYPLKISRQEDYLKLVPMLYLLIIKLAIGSFWKLYVARY